MQSNGGLTDAAAFRGKDAILSGPAGGIVGMAQDRGAGGLRPCDRLRHGRHLDRRLPFRRRLRADQRDASSRACGCGRRCWRSTRWRRAAARSAIMTAAASASGRTAPAPCRAPPATGAAGRSPSPTATSCSARSGPSISRTCSAPSGDQPIDADASLSRAARRSARAPGWTRAAVAEGFVRIAVDNMANAIKQISIARGHDVTRYTLAMFRRRRRPACLPGRRRARHRAGDDPPARRRAQRLWHGPGRHGRAAGSAALGGAELEDGARRAGGGSDRRRCAAQGVEAPEIRRRAALRYEGSDTSLEVEPVVRPDARGFRGARTSIRFGFDRAGGARSWSRRRSSKRSGRGRLQSSCRGAMGRGTGRSTVEGQSAPSAPPPRFGWSPSPRSRGEDQEVIDRATLSPGATIAGPALIIDPSATTVVEPGWQAEVDPLGNLILTRTAPRDVRRAAGHRGRSGACSSCSQPVHGDRRGDGGRAAEHRLLGQHQGTARFLLRPVRPRGRADRQCAAHPGPSRLDGRFHPHDHRSARPDATARRGRARDEAGRRLCAQRALSRRHPSARHHRDHAGLRRRAIGAPAWYVAARGHHADIGGIAPGSMPPDSRDDPRGRRADRQCAARRRGPLPRGGDARPARLGRLAGAQPGPQHRRSEGPGRRLRARRGRAAAGRRRVWRAR